MCDYNDRSTGKGSGEIYGKTEDKSRDSRDDNDYVYRVQREECAAPGGNRVDREWRFCVYLGSSNDSDRWQIYRRACSMARNHPRAHRDLDRVAISDSDQKRLRLARGNCLAYGRVSRRDFAPFSRVAPAMNRRFLYRNRDWTQFRSGPLMWLLLWLQLWLWQWFLLLWHPIFVVQAWEVGCSCVVLFVLCFYIFCIFFFGIVEDGNKVDQLLSAVVVISVSHNLY